MNDGLSIHVIDIASGRVAQGLDLSIERRDGRVILHGHIDERGLLPGLEALAEQFGSGSTRCACRSPTSTGKPEQRCPTHPFSMR